VTFSVLFVCICVLNYCHRVATQLQLIISYRINLRDAKMYRNSSTLLQIFSSNPLIQYGIHLTHTYRHARVRFMI